ncbi:hypothetical protein [Paenibacillus glycanilyticus]|uniref:Phage protein n=1 Tax=Paenibacillus glycanilyticus TaxID=126569 RepID=A0ABQ6GDB9_9BACL|nr:hypothetical protein [Paenibacillus glycanilyticus]GLX67263.1 hypothetical protein MU1_16080 [Paenibacillus glycanilyticus]
MKLVYHYDPRILTMEESANEEDIEFTLGLLDDHEDMVPRLKAVRRHFEDNEVYTDALFYSFPDHRYSAIVRRDYYTDFVLQLMKHRIVTRVEWV